MIHSALKRLEYRGYDSIGQVTVEGKTLFVKKDRGRLEEVDAKYNLDDMAGAILVGRRTVDPRRRTLILILTATQQSRSFTMAS